MDVPLCQGVPHGISMEDLNRMDEGKQKFGNLHMLQAPVFEIWGYHRNIARNEYMLCNYNVSNCAACQHILDTHVVDKHYFSILVLI